MPSSAAFCCPPGRWFVVLILACDQVQRVVRRGGDVVVIWPQDPQWFLQRGFQYIAVHGERAVTYRASIGSLREMPPRHDGVDGSDQFTARRHVEQRGIIADPENDAGLRGTHRIGCGGMTHEKAAYQFEFAEIFGPCAHQILRGKFRPSGR